MDSGCCSFPFNLYVDYLTDVTGLGRSWFPKDAQRKTRHGSPWRERVCTEPRSQAWGQQGGFGRHHCIT